MASRGFFPPVIRMKPAHCSKAFGPSFGTFLSSARELKRPLVSRYSTIFFASVLLIPETYSRRDADAVLRSTPTALTQVSTTPARVSSNFFWFMSC